MSQPRLKWREVERYFARHGYQIRGSGGDKIIIAPQAGTKGGRQVVRIGHKCCNHPGDELYPCYVSLLRRAFNVTPEQIREG